jgi:hypothetical protein
MAAQLVASRAVISSTELVSTCGGVHVLEWLKELNYVAISTFSLMVGNF